MWTSRDFGPDLWTRFVCQKTWVLIALEGICKQGEHLQFFSGNPWTPSMFGHESRRCNLMGVSQRGLVLKQRGPRARNIIKWSEKNLYINGWNYRWLSLSNYFTPNQWSYFTLLKTLVFREKTFVRKTHVRLRHWKKTSDIQSEKWRILEVSSDIKTHLIWIKTFELNGTYRYRPIPHLIYQIRTCTLVHPKIIGTWHVRFIRKSLECLKNCWMFWCSLLWLLCYIPWKINH